MALPDSGASLKRLKAAYLLVGTSGFCFALIRYICNRPESLKQKVPKRK